jgi:replicative DNA helicase
MPLAEIYGSTGMADQSRKDEFTRMGPTMDRLDASRIFIDDDANRTLTNIRSKARRLQMEHGLDLLIIDGCVSLFFDAKRMSFRPLNSTERSEPRRHALPTL